MSEKAVRKSKERASRLIAKGKLHDALEEYKKAVEIAPKDLSLRQKLAETYGRIGDKDKAVHVYQSVAGSYAADGLLLKAIAICKVILSLDPSHTETQNTLADLYATKRGDFAKPVTMPKSMSAAIDKPGRKRSASEIRGIPSSRIGPRTNPGEPAAAVAGGPPTPPPPENGPPTPPPSDSEIDLDVGGVEVISVEQADAPSLGAPLTTNLDQLKDVQAAAGAPSGDFAPDQDISLELEIDVMSGEGAAVPDAPVVGTPVHDDLMLVEDDDDDGDLLDIDEPAQVDSEDLPPIPLFSDLSKNAFIALTERMELVQAEPGEILIAEGEYATSMFIIIQGKVKVVREIEGGEELKLADLADGAFFGEMALLSDAPRTASVIALEETMLFEISRELMEDITREYPSVEQVMKRFHRNRLLTNLLRTSPIFAPFSPSDKKSLIEKFKSRNVEAGKLLITRDKPGDGLYVLLSGRCEVLAKKEGEDREIVLAELKDGDVFGEMSLLFRKFATASVRTASPCIVLRLPKKAFDELIMTHPQVLETLSSLSDERTRFNEELLDEDDEVLQDFLV
jgi:CRP-like cAMP-binding protein